MTEFKPTKIVNLHYSNVKSWLIANDLVAPHDGKLGANPQDIIDIDVQFAKLYFKQNRVAAVPDKISELIKSDITYLDAKTIYSFLEQKDGRGSAKNVFGLFHSEALKSWWTLLRSWEMGNLHICHALNTLVKRLGIDEPNIERKYQAAEKTFRTIDNRLIELQRASLSYDRAYSDERKAWKKHSKDRDSDSNDCDRDNIGDLNNIYCESVTDISSNQFTRSMDYVFAFSKFALQGSKTACNDYQSVYKCLRAMNHITSASDVDLSSSGHESNDVSGLEGLHCFIRDETFSQELLLELTGLRAFLNQKLIAIEAQEESEMNHEMPSSNAASAVEVFPHLKIVDAIILKLKNVRRILLTQRDASSGYGSRQSSGDQVQLLRERAVKYRIIFEELKQNRQDVACSLQRYASDSKKLRETCLPLRQWLDEELSKLTDATVTIRYG